MTTIRKLKEKTSREKVKKQLKEKKKKKTAMKDAGSQSKQQKKTVNTKAKKAKKTVKVKVKADSGSKIQKVLTWVWPCSDILRPPISNFVYEMYKNREGFRAVCKPLAVWEDAPVKKKAAVKTAVKKTSKVMKKAKKTAVKKK